MSRVCNVLFLLLFVNVRGDSENDITSPTTTEPTLTTSISDQNVTDSHNDIANNTVPKLPPYFNLPSPIRYMVLKLAESQNDHGYFEVRPGAFLFWWLYYADGTKEDAHTKPFVIWIQGGPSIPGSGLGNFVEIGPLTVTLKEKPYSWVRGKNVLFVDSPVGTGFSYVTQDDLLCKKDKDVAADLIQLMKLLLNKFPEFKTTPTHIFSQSYGTKIASYFAYYMKKEVENGDAEINLKSVALGGSWIDPKETMVQTVQYLFQMGFLDKREMDDLQKQMKNLTQMLDRNEYIEAFKYRNEMYETREANYDGNNVFKPRLDVVLTQLTQFMNGIIPLYFGPENMKKQWSYLTLDVYEALMSEFMKPAVHVVEKILSETDLRVVVYNGDLDSITPIAGAVNWVHNVNWPGREAFWNATRQPLKGTSNGYFKEHDKLSLWWILKAGHWVPSDNPEAMDQLLEYTVHEKRDFFNACFPDCDKIENLT